MGVLYSAHNVGCNREEPCNRIKRLAVVATSDRKRHICNE